MDTTRATRAPNTEASEVFEEMGLATPEQRDEVLAQNSASKPNESDVRYIIVLSNSSRPAPNVR